MVLVPLDTPGVRVERLLPAMGYLDAPSGHGEVSFTDVRLPADAIIGGPGRAFEIAQSRLGPGRVHHCMRLIGLAEAALELACERAATRTAFGKPLANLGGNRERIADCRIAIQQARLLVLHAAWLLDTQGLLGALSAVSQIKVAVPNVAQQVIDVAMQLHGGAGMSDDVPAGRRVDHRPRPAHRRRAGRGAPGRRRAHRARPLPPSGAKDGAGRRGGTGERSARGAATSPTCARPTPSTWRRCTRGCATRWTGCPTSCRRCGSSRAGRRTSPTCCATPTAS